MLGHLALGMFTDHPIVAVIGVICAIIFMTAILYSWLSR